MHTMDKIIIDPRIKYNYATWYIWGLAKEFGRNNIYFDIKPFESLEYNKLLQYNRGMPFVVEKGGGKLKVFIDYFDDESYEEDRYEWCDVYAKVNLTHEQLATHIKMMEIGPSFGIRDCGVFRLIFLAFSNILKSKGRTSMPLNRVMADYLYPYVRRRSLSDYSTRNDDVIDNYVFHLSTLWNGVKEKEQINDVRMEFLTACKESGINIEGGFYYIGANNEHYKQYLEEYKEFLFFNRIGLKEYLRRINKSFVVFNCPAVAGCLGWKLAEYLMMGKAIISMPINHPMPGRGLVHGDNIHIVHSKEEMKNALCYIRDNKEYREMLQVNAKQYFIEYLEPQKVIQRIINK